MPPRLLLVLPSNTYRASAFLDAARRLEVDLTVASDHANVFGASQPNHLLTVDIADPVRAAVTARAFAERTPVSAVFGVDDDTALAAAHIAAALGLRHNSVAACEAARDKHRQRVLLAREGVRVPAFALHRFDADVAAGARTAPYPCVLKPTRLSMSRGVMRADNPAAFIQAVGRLHAILAEPDARRSCGPAADVFLVEEFVPGREVAVEGLLRDRALSVLAIFDKPDPLDGPFFEETIYATPSDLDERTQLAVAACVERAAQALGLEHGPIHAEVRVNARGAWLIELAARPIGGRCSAILRFGEQAEISLEQLLLGEALSQATTLPLPARESVAAAVMMIPVPHAGTLVRVEGTGEARRVPWIDDVVITAHPGQALVPLPEGNRYLGFIYAWAEDAPTAVKALREAHAKLVVELA